jgi:hypothetical protein
MTNFQITTKILEMSGIPDQLGVLSNERTSTLSVLFICRELIVDNRKQED